ncbi:MAG: M23 family metallopeptidase [Chamaesiphon sp.]|nr:M23 family metallopeptidase [Chamaesiphon sp.]
MSFLIITGAFLSAQATIAQNTLPIVKKLVANNTLKSQVSVANSLADPVLIATETVPDVEILPTAQTNVFMSDVATIPGFSHKISAVPVEAQSDASVQIPVPLPLTQIIKGQPALKQLPSVKIAPTASATPTQPSNPLPLATEENQSPLPFIYPLTNPASISSRFGWRTHPLSGTRRFHSGLDLAAPSGSPVVATGSGTVISAGWNGGYGNAVIIQHSDTQQTLYGHLSKISVQAGQTIAQGNVIGLVGSTGNSTGPHLHFESRRLNTAGVWTAVNPISEIKYAVDMLRRSMPYARKDLPPGI